MLRGSDAEHLDSQIRPWQGQLDIVALLETLKGSMFDVD